MESIAKSNGKEEFNGELYHKKSKRGNFLMLFTREHIVITLFSCALLFIGCFTYYGVILITPKIFSLSMKETYV